MRSSKNTQSSGTTKSPVSAKSAPNTNSSIAPAAISAPVEPVLDMDDIQGIATPGFFKPHQTLLYIQVPDGREALLHFKAWLSDIAPEVATASITLTDRRH